jgi:hypothetical protein
MSLCEVAARFADGSNPSTKLAADLWGLYDAYLRASPISRGSCSSSAFTPANPQDVRDLLSKLARDRG